jgi:predicted  nucleic acid-binding Zn-ribbon protein
MSLEECQAKIEELRGAREALRNEAIRQKAAREAKGITKEPKQPKAKKEKVVDTMAMDMLAFLRGEKEI